MLSTLVWARSDYDEQLSLTDEGTIAACYLKRPDALKDDKEVNNEEEALNKAWLRFPSSELKSKLENINSDPDNFEYKSAFCEESLHRIIMDMGGGTTFLRGRCKALAENHEFFLPEMQGKGNSYIEGRTDFGGVTSAERKWCNGRAKGDLMKVACEYRKAKRSAYNQNSSAYKKSLAELKKRCGGYIGNDEDEPRRDLARDDGRISREPYLTGGGGHGGGGGSINTPIVIPRYIQQAPVGQWGGCQNNRGLNIINFQPSLAHTISTGLLAGFGAFLSYKGQKNVDNLTAQLASQNMRINERLGAATQFSAGPGGVWGPGTIMPYPGGAGSFPGQGGGMCGRPPFNTAHTGCTGGMPGMPIVNGGCPNGNCGGMVAGGCSPGMPCFGGNTGGQVMCPPGVMNCGAGMPGQFPGGCQNGNCNPNYPGNYMNNPANMARPGGMYGYNPYSLDAERQRIQDMQNALNKQIEDAKRAQQMNQQLADLARQRDAINNKFNTVQMGYNGLLANQFGPAPAYGHPGMYQGPGQPNMPGCMGAGGGGGANCACTTIMCYPGQQSAYYAPPYVYGNSGLGGVQNGYPNRGTHGFFGLNLQWSGVQVRPGTVNAR